MNVGDEFNPWNMFYGAWVPTWLMKRTELNSTAKLVYATLCRYGGRTGKVFPKVGTIALDIGCSDRAVRTAIQELEHHGLLRVKDRKAQSRSSVYSFLVNEWIVSDLREQAELELADEEEPPSGKVYRSPPANTAGASGTNFRSPPANTAGQEVDPSEENQEEEPIYSAGDASRSSTTYSSPAAREEHPHPRPEQKTEDAATAEPTSTDWVALAKAKSRDLLVRPMETIAAAKQKSQEARAAKLAKRGASEERRRAKEKQEREMGMEPEDVSPENPRMRLFHVYREEMKACFPNFPVPRQWSQREFGQTEKLLESYDLDQVEVAIVYVIRNWEALNKRFFKGSGDPVPTVGMVLAMHSSIFPQSVVWAEQGKVIEEYEAYGPANAPRPSELRDRYFEAVRQLKALGLDT